MAYTLQEMKSRYSNSLSGLNDVDAIYKIAEMTGEDPRELAEKYGVIAANQGDFSRGISSSVDSMQAGLYGLASWAAGSRPKEGGVLSKVRDWGYEGFKRNMGEVQLRSKATDNIENAETFGDYVDATQYWAGYAIPQIAEALIGSKGAGFVTRKSLERGVEKAIVKKYGKDLNPGARAAIMNSKAVKAQLDKIPGAVRKGEYAGIYGQAVGTELGHTYGGAIDEALSEGKTINDVDYGRATKFGLAAGAAEGLTDAFTLGLARLAPKGSKMQNLLGKDGALTSKSRTINATSRGLIGGSAEAGTEVLQTGLEEMGAGKTFEEADFSDPTSAFAGFVGGGMMGTVGGATVKKRDPQEILDEAAEDTAAETDAETERQNELNQQAKEDAELAEQQAQREAVEDLRDVHSTTFPSIKAWDAEQKQEKDIAQKVQLKNPQSELSVAFKAWRISNGEHLSNDKAENKKLVDKFLKIYNKQTQGTQTKQDLKEAHIAALDAHAALQEEKQNRPPEVQATIDSSISGWLERRRIAVLQNNAQELLAIEEEVADLDSKIPLVTAEWQENKRLFDSFDEALEETTGATEETTGATEAQTTGAKEEVVKLTKAEQKAKDDDANIQQLNIDNQELSKEEFVRKHPSFAGMWGNPEITREDYEKITEETTEETTGATEEATEETSSIDESVQSVDIKYKRTVYSVDRQGKVTNKKTGIETKGINSKAFEKAVADEFARIDAQFRAKPKSQEQVGPPSTANPFEGRKYRTVKGKKTLSKKWKRFDDALKEFGQDFVDQYPVLRKAVYNKNTTDNSFANAVETARELKKQREIVGGIFGKEMRVFGQIKFDGDYQKPVMEILFDAAQRDRLNDYFYFENGKWHFALKDIAKKLGYKEPTAAQRQAVSEAINAVRTKQEEYGEMAQEMGLERETAGDFLARTLEKMKPTGLEEEISTTDLEQETPEQSPQDSEMDAEDKVNDAIDVQRQDNPGLRIQKRASDTGVGKTPSFVEPTTNEEKEGAVRSTPSRTIKSRLEDLRARVPNLKRKATSAEKKAKAYPKNKNLQKVAKTKRSIATKADKELIGLKQEEEQVEYSKKRAELKKNKKKGNEAVARVKEKLSKAKKEKATKTKIKQIEKELTEKEASVKKINEEVKNLLSPEQRRQMAVRIKEDRAARSEGLLPEGEQTPESKLRAEEEYQEGLKLAKKVLNTKAKDDIALKWNELKSKDIKPFNKLSSAEKYDWAYTLVTTLNETPYSEGLVASLQKTVERRIRNEQSDSVTEIKTETTNKKPSKNTTKKKKSGATTDTDGKKDNKAGGTITKKSIEGYASKVLGRSWRKDYPIIVRHLSNGNKAKAMSFIEKQVSKFGTEVDKSSSPVVVNSSNEEMINNMFKNLLGQKTFDRIKNRIHFLTPAEASKKWGGNFENTTAAVLKRVDTKIQLDPRSPDGLSGFRERGKLDANDEIVFFPRNMEAGTELATFFHEIGGHIGLDNILSPSEQTALVAKIKGWAKEYDNYISNNTESGIDIAQAELMALEQGVLTTDEVVAGRAMARVKRLKTKGELKTPYPVNPNSPIVTRESSKETKESVAYFITESIQLYADTGGEFGTAPTVVPSRKDSPSKSNSVVAKILNKFRQSFRELIGYQKGETDNLTGQHIMDMALGAARIELEYGGYLSKTQSQQAKKVLGTISNAYSSTIAFMDVIRDTVTAQDISSFGLSDGVFISDSSKTVNTYWQKKIDDYVAKKLPKNEKRKYIVPNGQFLESTEWSAFQLEQGRREKAMRAGLKNIVEQRQREAQKNADAINESKDIVLDSDMSVNKPSLNNEEKKESKNESEGIRKWVVANFNSTVVQIFDNMAHLFSFGSGSTKFVHQIINEVAELMPAARAWYDAVLLSEKTRNRIKQTVEDIAVLARELPKAKLKQVNQFIAKATVEEKWAYNPYEKSDPKHAEVKIDAVMQKDFNALDSKQKEIIKGVFSHGMLMLERKKAIAQVLGVDAAFFNAKGITGPYAPLRRFGNYLTEFKSQALLDAEAAYEKLDSPENLQKIQNLKSREANYSISFHGTMGEAKRVRDEKASKYAFSRAAAKSKDVIETRSPEYKVLQKVLVNLDSTDIVRGSPEYKAIEQMVTEMYFESLDENNSRNSQRKRAGYAGYEQDMMKSFVVNAASEANLIANMEHGKSIYAALADAKKEAKKSDKLERVYNLMVSHHTASLTNKPTPIQDRLAAINTVYMLTSSIGYHVTNATQVMMVTIPKLVGDFGLGTYTKAIGLYVKGLRIASDVVTFDFNKLKFQTKIDIDKAPAKYKELLEELQLRQLLDVGMDQDLAEFNRSDSGFQMVDKGTEAMSTFSHRLYQVARLVEAYNRVSTATAAFELAEANKSKIKSMGIKNSKHYAIGMVEDTQGNFSSVDAPLILKKAPKVMGQYRKYQVMMAWVYSNAFKKATVGVSPQEKAVGRRTLGMLLGHAGFFSGAVGIPFSHLVAPLFMGIGEGEEPEDLERWIQENVQDKTLATMLSRGLPSVFGIDMSTKLSQQKIFSPAPYTDFSMSEDNLKKTFAEVILGPSSATISNFMRSYNYAKEGNAWRAIEYSLPKGVRTAMESYRLSSEGYSLRNGDIVASPQDFSGWQLLINALGIPATDLNQLKWRRGEQFELNKYFSEQQSKIRKEYVKAKKDRNSSAAREAMDDWKALQKAKDRVRPFFNDARGALRKTPISSLLRAPTRQQEREEEYRQQLRY